jgi:hypothetical protein
MYIIIRNKIKVDAIARRCFEHFTLGKENSPAAEFPVIIIDCMQKIE